MIMRISAILLLAFGLVSNVLASDYTISPASGPTSGGTEVTIKGDFGEWPYYVLFDGVDAKSTRRVDEHTLVAVTPAHLPGDAEVVIFEYDMFLATGLTFRFEGPVPETYERILLPLFTPPLFGAFGSEFHTDLRLFAQNDVYLWGIDESCPEVPPFPPVSCRDDLQLRLAAGKSLQPSNVGYIGTPGRFVYTTSAAALSANLRVHDVSRAALNFGTEMPIVRQREFTRERILLQGIPTDGRFRNTLRIYSASPAAVNVTIDGGAPVRIELSRAHEDLYTPFYAMFSAFPSAANPVNVTIDSVTLLQPCDGQCTPEPVWAFVSVTNNETQMITTITPQP